MTSTCAYCQKPLSDIACKGRDGLLYCSACCERAIPKDDILGRRLHSLLPKPIALPLPRPSWWVCIMVDRGGRRGGYFMVESGESPPSGEIKGEYHSIAAGIYEIVYGPCFFEEGEEFMADVEG